jgi:hypothetical protein
MQFDYPDANVHAETRVVTTTATQKLFLLNSPFVLQQAAALAQRHACEPGTGDEDRVIGVYELLFSRPPSLDELRLAVDFLRKTETAQLSSRWDRYLQMLLVSNEMLFVD